MKQKEVPMRYVIIFLCLLVNMNMNGQTRETNLIINVDGRKMTSLNGKWSAIIDPYETGYYNYRYEPDPNGYFKNARPRDKTERVEYDLTFPVIGICSAMSCFCTKGPSGIKNPLTIEKRPVPGFLCTLGRQTIIPGSILTANISVNIPEGLPLLIWK
jgi:hypothetical protein